jgi:hypothetical protein
MEKIQAWRNDPQFKELRQIGEKYAKFRAYPIEGEARPVFCTADRATYDARFLHFRQIKGSPPMTVERRQVSCDEISSFSNDFSRPRRRPEMVIFRPVQSEAIKADTGIATMKYRPLIDTHQTSDCKPKGGAPVCRWLA